jgi:hypothetical protein
MSVSARDTDHPLRQDYSQVKFTSRSTRRKARNAAGVGTVEG